MYLKSRSLPLFPHVFIVYLCLAPSLPFLSHLFFSLIYIFTLLSLSFLSFSLTYLIPHCLSSPLFPPFLLEDVSFSTLFSVPSLSVTSPPPLHLQRAKYYVFQCFPTHKGCFRVYIGVFETSPFVYTPHVNLHPMKEEVKGYLCNNKVSTNLPADSHNTQRSSVLFLLCLHVSCDCFFHIKPRGLLATVGSALTHRYTQVTQHIEKIHNTCAKTTLPLQAGLSLQGNPRKRSNINNAASIQ
ncbi:Hypothetical predicted protein [Xyrichtys novacula]|uniref:Uncharacterized protein n=1 Tax=Xyrichtys novacula TaxID=13765 RepID=A0AAV1FVX4_XYRNO|nr:Hypothetical predicted protein [Xyrichtys novacula]